MEQHACFWPGWKGFRVGWCPTAGVSWGCGRAPGVTVLPGARAFPFYGGATRCPSGAHPPRGIGHQIWSVPMVGASAGVLACCSSARALGPSRMPAGHGIVREQPDSLPSSQSPSLIGGSDELELPSSPSPKYICFITFSICFRISETLFFFFFPLQELSEAALASPPAICPQQASCP